METTRLREKKINLRFDSPLLCKTYIGRVLLKLGPSLVHSRLVAERSKACLARHLFTLFGLSYFVFSYTTLAILPN